MKALSKAVLVITVVLFLTTIPAAAYAQVEQIGGPYTNDSRTRLLLHFDGDFNNASPMSASAAGHGVYYFLPSDLAGMAQCLRLSNSSNTDSSYVTVPDTVTLDLTGDWTIEGWLNIFTFGEVAGEWRWVPRLVMKPGDDVFWHPNYWLEMWGDNRLFHTGYYVPSTGAFISNSSPNNVFVPGVWFHVTSIRDSANTLLIQMVHDANRNLISFEATGFDPLLGHPPNTTTQDLHIGWAGSKRIAEPSGDSWLDGFVDEIRISDVVRNFDIPPAVYKVSQLPNQPSTAASYEVKATVKKVGAPGTVTSAKLHYSVNAGAWQEVGMTAGANDVYTASIPGQPLGSRVRYYYSATDNSGHRTLNPSTAEALTDPAHYSFAVYQPFTQTLGLDFEEGSGVPLDKSPYNHTAQVIGTPTYTNEAAVGTKALYFPGDTTRIDVDSPFLSSEEFTIDFWMKPDTAVNYTRVIIRPIAWDNWGSFNYAIRYEPNNIISARFEDLNNIQNAITLDSAVVLHRWVRLIYEVSKDSAVFQMSDLSGRVIDKKGSKVTTPPKSTTAPLRIGNAHNISVAGWEDRSFKGIMDDLKVYNYPAAGLTVAVRENGGAGVPGEYTLLQNFPNPFNPTTKITYSIAKTERVILVIYDVLGRKVRTLVDQTVAAGRHTVSWDGKDRSGSLMASGIYFYKLQTKDYSQVRKMAFLK